MIYKADLHIHSSFSFDSRSRPEAIVRTAAAKGLNVIAVTDHGTIAGGLACRRYAEANPKLGVQVVVGSEITTPSGDIHGLFLTEEINSKDPEEVIACIRSQGGLSVYVHPYREGEPDERLIELVDAIEIYNGRSSARENLMAQNLVLRLNKVGLAGSDAHKPGEIGKAYTVFTTDESDSSLFSQRLLSGEIRPVINE
ncbi:MAG: PHP domain-containing protein [Deltaproteobacteria bacterium]|nr:PHP domain-containing protein [Deltaproteobacteria bacterium]